MEEIKKLVQTQNIELTDEQFDEVVGGYEIITNLPSNGNTMRDPFLG